MPEVIEIVGQRAMDLYYTNYKSNSEYFDLEDFVAHCGGVLGAAYEQEYQRARAEMRQEKRDEIVALDASILIPEVGEVKEDDQGLYTILGTQPMAFPFDNQGIGVQDVDFVKPKSGIKFERTTAAGKYALDYIPTCMVIWFYVSGNKIRFVNKTNTKFDKIVALIAPSVNSPKLLVPDGIVEYVITTAAMTIKQGASGTIVKKASDSNPNKIIQTEADLSSLKPG